ncbi:MAG: YitT family protein, partial [Tissierella sp.]|uniref:YitT family protein n=1 Tax=Tissierella sp. TaxID=41274 RepID=UPI003F98AE30
YIGYQVVDKVQTGFSNKKNVIIVSEKPQEIADEIITSLKRGVTFLDGTGGYSEENKKVIYCIIVSKEVVKIKNIIDEIDPTAFLIVTDVVEVKGTGFKEIGI